MYASALPALFSCGFCRTRLPLAFRLGRSVLRWTFSDNVNGALKALPCVRIDLKLIFYSADSQVIERA